MNKLFCTLFLVCSLAFYGCSQKVANTSLPAEYAQFLSCFSDSTYYAVENITGHEVLLVSNEVFPDGNKPEAIAAQLYMLDAKGKMVSLGEIRSQGTLYPLALSDSTLLTAGHHYVSRYAVMGNPANLTCTEYADESFDQKGNATYSYENRKTNEYTNPDDNQKLTLLFAEFEKARTIVFRPCDNCSQKTEADAQKSMLFPLPTGLDLSNLTDATVAASFTSDDFKWMGGNLTMTVYAEQLYDAVDLHTLQVEDTIFYSGNKIVVKTKDEKEGEILINGGFENNGVTLWPYDGGTYRAVQFDDHSVYVELGKAELPLSENFTIIDCKEDPQAPSDTISTNQKLYLENLKDSRREFIDLNTLVQIEQGIITNITRRWIP